MASNKKFAWDRRSDNEEGLQTRLMGSVWRRHSTERSVVCSYPSFYTVNWSKLSSLPCFRLPAPHGRQVTFISYLSKKLSQRALQDYFFYWPAQNKVLNSLLKRNHSKKHVLGFRPERKTEKICPLFFPPHSLFPQIKVTFLIRNW